MANHDTTLTLQLIRLLEHHPTGLGAPACWKILCPRQTLNTVYSILAGLMKRNIVVRDGTYHHYTYRLHPDFRRAFAGVEETPI